MTDNFIYFFTCLKCHTLTTKFSKTFFSLVWTCTVCVQVYSKHKMLAKHLYSICFHTSQGGGDGQTISERLIDDGYFLYQKEKTKFYDLAYSLCTSEIQIENAWWIINIWIQRINTFLVVRGKIFCFVLYVILYYLP